MSIIYLVVLLLSCTSLVSCTNDDEIALLKIKQQLSDPGVLSDWVEGFDFCKPNPSNVWRIACSSTGRVTNLMFMDNLVNFTAPFPDAICDLTELELLLIFHNPNLYGPITCMNKLLNLQTLVITDTSLSGSLPSFTNQTNLQQIVLERNHFSGTIPPFSTQSKLNSLYLSSNNLTGTIPPSLSALQELKYLDLSSNYFTGTIPSGLVHGSSAWLILSNNYLTGELPRYYGWVNFSLIDLRNNQLSGDVSFLFGKQKTAYSIVLANNKFEFDLSDVEISDQLNLLDLSRNKIYGSIPNSFSASKLSTLDLSCNALCGEIPQGGIMWRFTAASFENNKCLCGSPLPPCSTSAPAPRPI